MSDELRNVRRSCSNQRALFHSQVEKLQAEASRLLVEEANVPGKLAQMARGNAPKPLLGAPGMAPPTQIVAHSTGIHYPPACYQGRYVKAYGIPRVPYRVIIE